MTTSERAPSARVRSDGTAPTRAFVWVWLPGATEPVVAGRIDDAGAQYTFTYGRSYLARTDAVALYLPELPLSTGVIRPPAGLTVPGCLRDGGPDAWGQRLVLARHAGSDTDELSLLTYLLESGSDRIGALDFQTSADSYLPRAVPATLQELQSAASDLEHGKLLSAGLADALLRGTSIGGARPKALLDDGDRHLIAKFSSTTDTRPVVRAEGVAMELARRVGLHVAGSEVIDCRGKDVLLVERFDRTGVSGQRRMMVSALTVLGLDEFSGARYGSYAELADEIRARFTDPVDTLHELFSRIVFNICVGNIDDHARNQAAFVDGAALTLTPAYDLCPQPRSGEQAQQAMAIGRDGQRRSQFRVCLEAAGIYLLRRAEAQEIIDRQVSVIIEQWNDAADVARLTEADRTAMWHRQILNPFIFYDQ